MTSGERKSLCRKTVSFLAAGAPPDCREHGEAGEGAEALNVEESVPVGSRPGIKSASGLYLEPDADP